ncbi:MAG: TatD family hydrolase [Muribaculaceae bacterium]|nr:TatD family hydrolase [Muribaculaceae bacterium]
MNTIVDFHTHRTDATAALIAVDPRRFDPQPGKWYSVGFHPWDDVDMLTVGDFDLLRQCATHPQVLAVGETGMDRLRGGDLVEQEAAFVRHLQLARDLGKPVVVHNVRATREILDARNRAGLDDVTLVIHGMRGNAHVARTLLDAGCYLSYGPRFNAAALQATPPDRLLIETDDSDIPITDVATQVARTLTLTTPAVMQLVTSNAQRLLFPLIPQ